MARPTLYDNEVLSAAVDSIFSRLVDWLQENPDSEEAENIKEQVIEAADRDLNLDGYRVSKSLEERFCWEPNSDLVSILDDLSFGAHSALSRQVAAWVTKENITAQCKIGDLVTFKRFGKEVRGEVVRIDELQATYTVYCESEGHVREGTGIHGTIVPFEDVQVPQ